MKRIAIVQSNYIPWRGYFDLIASADEFIIFDDMQYTRRDWRNRNKIKTPNGTQWLSIPVRAKGKYFQKIRDTQLLSHDWAANHWKSIQYNYSKAKYFNEVTSLLHPLYDRKYETLSEVNTTFISSICEFLGIKTKISYSWNYSLVDGKSQRLASLAMQANGTHYLSGPAAKEYLDTSYFMQNDIRVEWFDYSSYAPYDQLWGEFDGEVSIIDLLFNHGLSSRAHMISGS